MIICVVNRKAKSFFHIYRCYNLSTFNFDIDLAAGYLTIIFFTASKLLLLNILDT